MDTTQKFGHEIGLLRQVVKNIHTKALPEGNINLNLETISGSGLLRCRIGPDRLVGLKPSAVEKFNKLAELLFSNDPHIKRGTCLETRKNELMDYLIKNYFSDEQIEIENGDVIALKHHFQNWFLNRVDARTFFVPCKISPNRSAQFDIGPITFIHLDDFLVNDYPKQLDPLFNSMRAERAFWLAIVKIENCDSKTANELCLIAIDLAIGALQIASRGLETTRNMSRLAVSGLNAFPSLSTKTDLFELNWPMEAGLLVESGCLSKIIQDGQPFLSAAGNRIKSFTTGDFRFETLERAWCDAAYWLHQGFAEPIDSIAVTKFETAIEVLLRSESSKLSKEKVIYAMEVFFGMKPGDPIESKSEITTKKFAENLSKDRSKILHGTISTLGSELSASREGLEKLAVSFIFHYACDLDAYIRNGSAIDERNPFLEWVKANDRKLAEPQC